MFEYQPDIHVLAFAGSLRQNSFNRAAVQAAGQLLPEGMTMEYFDLAGIPLYNDDIYRQGFPERVQQFRERLAAADAVLIASPEYNFSVPGVLKNALDWASRPPDQPLADKPLAIMGVSPGGFGTVRMQNHLRDIAVHLNMHPLNKPELMISRAREKFDADLNLVDEPTREKIAIMLRALRDWTIRLRVPVAA